MQKRSGQPRSVMGLNVMNLLGGMGVYLCSHLALAALPVDLPCNLLESSLAKTLNCGDSSCSPTKDACEKIQGILSPETHQRCEQAPVVPWHTAELCQAQGVLLSDESVESFGPVALESKKKPFKPQWQLLLENWNYQNHDVDWPLRSGAIRFSRGVVGRIFQLGEFFVDVASQSSPTIRVYHGRNRGHVLWETLPGQPFILAGHGDSKVTQWRGSFTVLDQKGQKECTSQTIDRLFQKDDTTLVIQGTLEGRFCQADYTFEMRPEASKRLGFAVTVHPQDSEAEDVNRVFLRYKSHHEEEFYGFGEQFTHFNLKGRKVPILAQEQGHLRGLLPWTPFMNRLSPGAGGYWYTTYTALPHYVTSDQRSLFLEDTEYALFDLQRRNRVTVRVWKSSMKGQIVYGDSPLDLISEYTAYTGRMPLLPDWSHQGAIVGLMGGSERVRGIWDQLRAEDTPVSAFWLQDWVGKRDTGLGIRMWWNWELDERSYPDWHQLVDEFQAEGIEVLGYFNPFVTSVAEKSDHRINLFQVGKDKGYLVRDQDGEELLIDSGGFNAAMVDFSNPEARSWYTDHLARAVKAMNMKGWMADFGEALPFEAEMASGETGEAYHNRYIQEWAKVNREVLVQSGLKDDGFFFLRASAGQAHGATSLYWLGDQMVTWDQHDGLKSSITGLLSGGISGMAVNHSDIGGLIGLRRKVLGYKISFARDAELLLRWAEMNAFTPFYRTHEGNNPKLNHQFYSDQKTLKGFAYFAKVYSFLAPYRSKLFRDAHEKGIPVVRHPYLHYPKDPVARSLKYQFMLGDEFMVAPVTSPGQLEQQVYLPQGGWVHLWSDEVFDLPEGRTITIASPVGQPPVFFKEQSQYGQMLKNKVRNL